MVTDKLIELLNTYGFSNIKNKGSDYQQTNYLYQDYSALFKFDQVFVDMTNTEMYIIQTKNDKTFTREEIVGYEEMIKGFIYSTRNEDGIRYNINLILICPIDKKSIEYREVVGLERDKYTCRKIFINSNSKKFQEELIMLPFIPISSLIDYDINFIVDKEIDLKKMIFNSEVILEQLLSKEPKLNIISKELVELSSEGGEN